MGTQPSSSWWYSWYWQGLAAVSTGIQNRVEVPAAAVSMRAGRRHQRHLDHLLGHQAIVLCHRVGLQSLIKPLAEPTMLARMAKHLGSFQTPLPDLEEACHQVGAQRRTPQLETHTMSTRMGKLHGRSPCSNEHRRTISLCARHRIPPGSMLTIRATHTSSCMACTSFHTHHSRNMTPH